LVARTGCPKVAEAEKLNIRENVNSSEEDLEKTGFLCLLIIDAVLSKA
jgi:hypothetical protein